MRLFVFGAGYVGIPYAAGLASLGHDVTIYDPDGKRISALAEGKSPIFEPGLDALLDTHKARLFFTSSAAAAEMALAAADAAFSCVGTPERTDGRGPDLKFVLATAEMAGRAWRAAPAAPARTFVVKSTVPPSVIAPVREVFEGTPTRVISNPEFLCLHGDAMISVPGDHRTGLPVRVPLKSLVGKSGFPVYAFDVEANRFRLATATRVWETKIATELVALTFDDGAVLRCTPDHQILNYDGVWVEAGTLKPQDRLTALHHRYEVMIKDGNGAWVKESRLVGEWLTGRTLTRNDHVDHADPLRLDNSPVNLRVLTAGEHAIKTHTGRKLSAKSIARRVVAQKQWANENPEKMRAFTQKGGAAAQAKFKLLSPEARRASIDARLKKALETKRRNGTLGTQGPAAWKTRREKYGPSGGNTGRPKKEVKQNHKVVAVERLFGEFPVYDMTVEGLHNFVADGVVVHNCEGSALRDFFNPARIVMGCDEVDREFALQLAQDLYGHRNAPIHVVRHASAWLTKYGANGLLATKVIFTNELARLAQAVGGDIEEIRAAMQDDPRVGSWGLQAGAGAFGPCFAKDLHALETFAATTMTKTQPFFEGLNQTNHAHCHALADWLHRELLAARSQRVAVWGTAFKAGTDDARTSGAVTILLQLGAWFAGIRNAPRFHLSDPMAIPQTQEMLARSSMAQLVDYEPDHVQAARASDTLIVLTEWDAYARVSSDEWKQIAGTCKRVIDLRRVVDRRMVERAGISYKALGVGAVGDET